MSSSRSGHSSQGVRRKAKHAERAQDLLAYQKAYGIVNGAASEFNGARGCSSEDDTRGTRLAISGLRTSLRQARDRLQSRDHLVEGVLERLRTPRPCRQDALAVPQGGHTNATSVFFSRQNLMTPNRAGGRCDLPTPKQSPVSRPRIASWRRWCHRLRVVLDLLFVVARWGRRGERGLPSRACAPMLRAQNSRSRSREGMAP